LQIKNRYGTEEHRVKNDVRVGDAQLGCCESASLATDGTRVEGHRGGGTCHGGKAGPLAVHTQNPIATARQYSPSISVAVSFEGDPTLNGL